MRMIEITLEGRRPIDAYGPGGFRVDGAWHDGSLILTPSRAIKFHPPLDQPALAAVLAEAKAIDVLLIGQGAETVPLSGDLIAMIEDTGLGVEIMGTASACRTYNVLLAEDRRVAAVLVAL